MSQHQQPWMTCPSVPMRGTPVAHATTLVVPVFVPVAVVVMITPPTIIDVRGHEAGWPGEVDMAVPVEDFFDGELPIDDEITIPGDYLVLEATGTGG